MLRRRQRNDASGRSYVNEVGQLTAQLLHPVAQTPVGPKVTIDVMRGAVNVPNRAGTAFFHKLAGCRVVWELDARLWSVEYP